MLVSIIASTGHASSQKPQYIHLKRSISYLVVRLVLSSALSSVSIVIASAGHTASQSLQPIHLSSPFGYFLSAWRPRNLVDCGVFSSGY